jgi:colanic acid/amylovoran biosynthesis glycosyltransferase
MRIAYLVSQYPAASHTFIRREVKALRSRGHTVHTFSVRPPTGFSKLSPTDQAESKATHYILPAKPVRLARAHLKTLLERPLAYANTLKLALSHRAPGLKALVWSAFHFAESMDLAAELEERGVDHLHNHFANSGAVVGYLAAHYLDLIWSFTIHGASEFDYPAGILLAEKIEAADFVACVTHFGRSQAMRLVEPKHWHKFHIVRAGIEPPVVPKTSNGMVKKPRLVCVARLAADKGHAGLLEAFAALVKDGVDVDLELLGSGPEEARLQEQIRNLGIGSHVRLYGQVSEEQALEAMSTATAVVLASFMEGLPCVLMEALAMGVPVVAPCVAGIPELVEHGVSGLTFPPGDWASLAKVLRQMLGDAELRSRLAAEGKRRVESEFLVERSLPPLISGFEALHAARPEKAGNAARLEVTS